MNIYKEIEIAKRTLDGIIVKKPLEFSKRLSDKYKAKIYLKREDLQVVRSYKIRGAYNKLKSLSKFQMRRGIVCASAGNHAQGVAFSCALLKMKGSIYLPKNTPRQKIDRIKSFGGKWIDLILIGDTFNETNKVAERFSKENKMTYIHPFDDNKIIAGQGTLGLEILEELEDAPHFIVVPVGGGGLMAGVSIAVKKHSNKTKLIGVEPEGAASMIESFRKKRPVSLESIDTFVDGAAVIRPGDLTFKICYKNIDKMLSVPEGKVCADMIDLYQYDGIIAEPAGALSISALDSIKSQIKGKLVVCIISGGNNDLSRYSEIMERSLIYKGLKHYFIIDFPQRSGALKSYLDEVVSNGVDISLFEYIKKNNRETGPALVGLELTKKQDLKSVLDRMDKLGFEYEIIKPDSPLFRFVL